MYRDHICRCVLVAAFSIFFLFSSTLVAESLRTSDVQLAEQCIEEISYLTEDGEALETEMASTSEAEVSSDVQDFEECLMGNNCPNPKKADYVEDPKTGEIAVPTCTGSCKRATKTCQFKIQQAGGPGNTRITGICRCNNGSFGTPTQDELKAAKENASEE